MVIRLSPKARATPRMPTLSPWLNVPVAKIAVPGPPITRTAVPMPSASTTRVVWFMQSPVCIAPPGRSDGHARYVHRSEPIGDARHRYRRPHDRRTDRAGTPTARRWRRLRRGPAMARRPAVVLGLLPTGDLLGDHRRRAHRRVRRPRRSALGARLDARRQPARGGDDEPVGVARGRRSARAPRRPRPRSRPVTATTWSSMPPGTRTSATSGSTSRAVARSPSPISRSCGPTDQRGGRGRRAGVPERFGHHAGRLDVDRRRVVRRRLRRVRHRRRRDAVEPSGVGLDPGHCPRRLRARRRRCDLVLRRTGLAGGARAARAARSRTGSPRRCRPTRARSAATICRRCSSSARRRPIPTTSRARRSARSSPLIWIGSAIWVGCD